MNLLTYNKHKIACNSLSIVFVQDRRNICPESHRTTNTIAKKYFFPTGKVMMIMIMIV
jgi:hypothetical protein